MARKRPKKPEPEPSGVPTVSNEANTPNDDTIGDRLLANLEQRYIALEKHNRELMEQLDTAREQLRQVTVVADAQLSGGAGDLAASEASRAEMQRELTAVKQRLFRMRELALPAMVFSCSLLGMFGLDNLTENGMKRYKELCDLIPEMQHMPK